MGHLKHPYINLNLETVKETDVLWDLEVDVNVILFLYLNILFIDAASVPDYIESTDRMKWKRVWARFTLVKDTMYWQVNVNAAMRILIPHTHAHARARAHARAHTQASFLTETLNS
jgi:hypothetical protein